MVDSQADQEKTISWTRFTEADKRSHLNWGSRLTLLIGLALAVGAVLTHIFLGVVVGIAIAALFLPFYLTPARRASVDGSHVVLKRQLLWRNPWVWFTCTITVAALGALVSAPSGDGPRALVVGLLGLGGAALSATQAYRLRGPLKIASTSLVQAKYEVPLRAATVEVNESGPKTPPMVRITPTTGATTKLTSYTIDPWNYGIDVNTMASTLSQMVRWLESGREATPIEILAMLTVVAPPNVPVGSAVEISMSATNPVATPPITE